MSVARMIALRLCLDTHRPTAPFSTPSQPFAAGFSVCISIRFLKFSVTNVRYPVSMARLPPQRNLEADPCAEAPVPPGAGLDFACLVGGRTAGGGRMGPPRDLRGRSHFGYVKPAENLDALRRKSPSWVRADGWGSVSNRPIAVTRWRRPRCRPMPQNGRCRSDGKCRSPDAPVLPKSS